MSRLQDFIAVLILNLLLGSLYAWSVIARALEAELGMGRAEASSIFSTATVCFVLAMLFAPRTYSRLGPGQLAFAAAALACGGVALAATTTGLAVLLVGYGLLFGLANGIGYGLSLQIASQVVPGRRGLAVGSVVAAYAGGAIVAAPLLSWAAAAWGIATTLLLLALCFLALALLCPLLLRGSGAIPRRSAKAVALSGEPWFGRTFTLLWIGYALGASAGLMMIGHAATLVDSVRGSEDLIVLGASLVAAGNWLGRFGAGWASDHLSVRRVLAAALLLNVAALSLVLLLASPLTVLIALALVGAGYGSLAAGYPIAVGRYYQPDQVAAVYGKLFTAWGVAGVAGPWIAGRIFEVAGSYGDALALAVAATLVALLATAILPKPTTVA
ncbi:MAG: hypothetical protein Kilf2KO_04770 [Rhodospirillales bacterium]